MRLTIASAALLTFALAAPALAQTATPANQGKFCLQGPGTNAKTSCTFASMADCEKAKQGAAQRCVPNTMATTGSGTGMRNNNN